MKRRISKEIGATRKISISNKKLGTPLSWLHLANELNTKLISSGGRPSDPEWKIKRLIPFKKEVWDILNKKARLMSMDGRSIGPAQLAAVIIEGVIDKDK